MKSELPITTLDIQNEMDVMLAHRRGMQFARFSGISLPEQTRFATAVSEICRNALEYAMKGSISFSIIYNNDKYSLQAIIKDEGKGIASLADILHRKPESFKGRGLGIVFAQRLADMFRITSNAKGTIAIIQKNIPSKNPIVNNLIIQGWLKHLQKEPVISAYEELKMRNIQLVELTEELRSNSEMVEKQMEEIRLLNDRLSTSNERMKEFTYAISHDLKTPLSSLKLAAEHLFHKPADNEFKTYLGILSRSVGRLDKTIHSLTEIIDTQNQQQLTRELDFRLVFDYTQEAHKELIAEINAKIEVDFSDAPSILYIEGYLQSLFHNLLSNALKYRDPDRPLEIRVGTRRTGRGVRLSFADNGIGMDMEKISDRIFVPFNRFSSHPDGKGIGLYLVKGMIENNGGRVSVESEPGKGTTFSFDLRPY